MLREVFRTVPIPYAQGAQPAFSYGANKPPYLETAAMINGLWVSSQAPTADNMSSRIFVFMGMATNWWPSWNVAYWTFDGLTGAFIRRIPQQGNLGTFAFIMSSTQMSRNGLLWANNYYSNVLSQIDPGQEAMMLVGDDPPDPQPQFSWTTAGPEVGAGKFKTNVAGTADVGFFGSFAIDDSERDTFMNTYGAGWGISFNSWKTGAFKYRIEFPAPVISICLEDDSRCYVLLGNNTLILLDYTRGEVMGSAQIPPTQKGKGYPSRYWNNPEIEITWDPIYRRLLLLQVTPDNPDGSSTMRVRGFNMVNDPCRITTPIPLKVPRQGRTIPVLVQVVDELNHGVGGYAVEAKVL